MNFFLNFYKYYALTRSFNFCDCISKGILQTVRLALMAGIAVALVYPTQQIIALLDITVMEVQLGKTGNLVQKDISALVVTNLNLVLLAITKMKRQNLLARNANLDFSARIHL